MRRSFNENIKFYYQDNDATILNKINKVFFKDTWVNGSFISNFEIKLKKYFKTNKMVSTCNSGTDALKLALLLDRHKSKNIYITTPLSYIASSSVAKSLELEIIYIDIDKDNYLLDINKLENFLKKCPKKIKDKIKGIINVEIFGSTNNLTKLKKISKKYNLTLIGDCAQSFGTKFNNINTVNYYDYSALSFYPTKIFSCYGDGGALVLSKSKFKKAILLKNNGHTKQDKENCKVIGINSRLDTLQAYVLLNKLSSFKKILKKRYENKKFLENNISSLKLPKFDNKLLQNNFIFTAFIHPKLRKNFIKHMKKNKIECLSIYKKLLNKNLPLKPYIQTNLANANHASKSLVCIPSHEKLNLKKMKKIANAINNFKI
jgi:dTDP-4-amino-4,6-dideoxygalactose transaminase